MRLLHILTVLTIFSWWLLMGYISEPRIRRYLSRKGSASGMFRKKKTSRYSNLVFTGTTKLGNHWRTGPIRVSKLEALTLGALLDTSKTLTVHFPPGLKGIPQSVTLSLIGKDGIPESPTGHPSV